MGTNLNIIDKVDWPAEDYAIGTFVQATFADQSLKDFAFNSDDNLLDIGCGDGSYTLKLANHIPHGKVSAIDFSEKMISRAKQQIQEYNNVTFEHMDATKINAKLAFSAVTALWSLQWVPDFKKVLENISCALQPNGRFFAIYPVQGCLYDRLYQMVKNSGKFHSLENVKIERNTPSIELGNEIGKALGFKYFKMVEEEQSLDLPSLETFHKFVNGIGFYQGKVPEIEIPLINEEMVKCFDQICQQEFAGNYVFKDRFAIINAIK